jgi:hypothetical protein
MRARHQRDDPLALKMADGHKVAWFQKVNFEETCCTLLGTPCRYFEDLLGVQTAVGEGGR